MRTSQRHGCGTWSLWGECRVVTNCPSGAASRPHPRKQQLPEAVHWLGEGWLPVWGWFLRPVASGEEPSTAMENNKPPVLWDLSIYRCNEPAELGRGLGARRAPSPCVLPAERGSCQPLPSCSLDPDPIYHPDPIALSGGFIPKRRLGALALRTWEGNEPPEAGH